MSWSSLRRGQLAGLAAPVLLGCSAPLISMEPIPLHHSRFSR